MLSLRGTSCYSFINMRKLRSILFALVGYETVIQIDYIFRIVQTIRRSLKMDLLGIDVVIDNESGKYAVIDVNPFPSEF